MEMDAALTLISIASFFTLILAWVGRPPRVATAATWTPGAEPAPVTARAA